MMKVTGAVLLFALLLCDVSSAKKTHKAKRRHHGKGHVRQGPPCPPDLVVPDENDVNKFYMTLNAGNTRFVRLSLQLDSDMELLKLNIPEERQGYVMWTKKECGNLYTYLIKRNAANAAKGAPLKCAFEAIAAYNPAPPTINFVDTGNGAFTCGERQPCYHVDIRYDQNYQTTTTTTTTPAPTTTPQGPTEQPTTTPEPEEEEEEEEEPNPTTPPEPTQAPTDAPEPTTPPEPEPTTPEPDQPDPEPTPPPQTTTPAPPPPDQPDAQPPPPPPGSKKAKKNVKKQVKKQVKKAAKKQVKKSTKKSAKAKKE